MIRRAGDAGRGTTLSGCLRWILAAALVMAPPVHGARAQTPPDTYELRPEIHPTAVLPEGAVATGDYRVLDEVRVNGNWLEFRIESDVGNFNPRSLAMLSTRIAEIRTLSNSLNEYRRTDPALADRLRDQFVRAGVFLVPSLARPSESEDSVYAALEPDAPVLAAHKRRIANRLGLDAYSTNPLVQNLLDTLVATRTDRPPVQSAVAVPLPVSATGAPASPQAIELTVGAALERLSIGQLVERNRERLEGLGIEADLIEVFLRHRMLSPRHKTVITEHLVMLDGVQNRNSLLITALGSTTEHEGAAYAQVARMLTLFHRHVSPLTKLIPAGPIVLATTDAKGIVVVLPFDVVYWNSEARRIFNGFARYAAERHFRHWTLLTEGILTDTAQGRLLELKFDLITRFLDRLSDRDATKVPSADMTQATTTAATIATTPPSSSATGDSADWIRRQPMENYTIQVLATKNLDALVEFRNKNRFADDVGWFPFQRDGDTWFALLHGSYASREAAKLSITGLPGPARNAGVWIRRFSEVHAIMEEK